MPSIRYPTFTSYWNRSVYFITPCYDPCLHHVEARFCSDCLRILFGTVYNKKDDWDTLDASKFSTIQIAAAKFLFQWAKDLCENKSEICCHHDFPISINNNHVELIMACDSSLYGAGFVLTMNSVDGPVIAQSAWIWRGSQLSYHSNRREMACLLKAV